MVRALSSAVFGTPTLKDVSPLGGSGDRSGMATEISVSAPSASAVRRALDLEFGDEIKHR